MKSLALTVLFLGSIAWGQLPDAPTPQPKARSNSEHEFFDRTNVVGIVGMVGLHFTDTAMTCNYMRTYQNVREVTAPFKTCAGVAFYLQSISLASFAGMRAAHDAGHHRIERLIPYMEIALSAGSIAWNLHASKDGVKCRQQFGCGGSR